MITRRQLLQGLAGLSVAGLVGCDDPAQRLANLAPVPIQDGDECALCGMFITRFPGPKGEAFMGSDPEPLKFCSTRDLFAYLTQPETKTQLKAAYVHDLGATGWEQPADSAFVEAREAWYVADQPLPGAMGPTLASFAARTDAEAFIAEHGGRLLAYQNVDAGLISGLKRGRGMHSMD